MGEGESVAQNTARNDFQTLIPVVHKYGVRCHTAFILGSALHVMLFLENLLRALLIFNGLRSRHGQQA